MIVVAEAGITKRAVDADRHRRPLFAFANARTALEAFLRTSLFGPEDEVLLPAYVGWSPREGSGVLDPVQRAGLRRQYYRLTRDLRIDVDDVCRRMKEKRPRLLVVIHYFGRPDAQLEQVVACARDLGVLVLEDEAHALYSDWVGGVCGRMGDACIYSLHKMLPVDAGGLLSLNVTMAGAIHGEVAASPLREPLPEWLPEYDLAGISAARRRNAAHLRELISPLSGRLDLLWPELPSGVVPQTLPVIVRTLSRDALYFRLNEAGFGAVSLYHTLVDEVAEAGFPDSHWVARRILNLPVHQDIQEGDLERLAAALGRIVSEAPK